MFLAVDGRNPAAPGLVKTWNQSKANGRSWTRMISTAEFHPWTVWLQLRWYSSSIFMVLFGMIITTNSGSLVPNFTYFPFQRWIWIRIDFRFCWVQIGLQALLGIFEHSNLEIGEVGGIDGGYRVQCESHLRMLSDAWFTLFLWISSFKHVLSGQICAHGISIIPRGTTCKGRIEFAVPEEFLACQMSVCYHG